MTMHTPAKQEQHTRARPDLADRKLILLLTSAGVILVAYAVLHAWLPDAFDAPGSPLLQSSAILGSLLLLVPFAFSLAKRTGHGGPPTRWFIGHVFAAVAGFVLVAIHSAGRLEQFPALLFLAGLALIVSGAVARLRISRDMAATLGSKSSPFRVLEASERDRLRELIGEKTELLTALQPGASEATFSVTLRHCFTAPKLAYGYHKLASEERRIMGTRQSVGRLQAFWRPFHMMVAWLFGLGLVIHVVVVLFFAGYVAGDRDIYWWHFTAW